MMTATIYNQSTGEARTLEHVHADHLARNSRGAWSFAKPLPAGWDRELPRYRASIDLRPSQYARHRQEPPFTSCSDTHMWQYAERPIAAGEEITTTAWPHASLVPLNETAKRAREYFTSHQRSRLPQSPWRAGRLYLDDGLSGAVPQERLLGRRPEPAVPSPIRAAGR
ncbi:hypothetical protein BSZ19_47055 [Bradyrhizobium japonicum]|uniref:Uncharacterized protein n=1 Tax=Bradyrhizobium japonicum TaxID=375 RepID=A0A1Y2J7R1_BRAJP|nr:hypothetical protein [Bradyrhizobium japonicum]OSJ22151.1 hypothetical protein BSZ19_47055 [Bradyrhizobium japonicum]